MKILSALALTLAFTLVATPSFAGSATAASTEIQVKGKEKACCKKDAKAGDSATAQEKDCCNKKDACCKKDGTKKGEDCCKKDGSSDCCVKEKDCCKKDERAACCKKHANGEPQECCKKHEAGQPQKCCKGHDGHKHGDHKHKADSAAKK